MGALAEMERGLISERTTEAMNEMGGMYDYMAWQVEHNGMATAAVARSLNKRGITGKRGGKWQGKTIYWLN